ncbi:MAG: ADP-ribosylglycohydrolase family protein [Clostridia bacterium]|nr:ADP-ribosylglycohydrolase family protein [Clostridia bacterium]
MTKIKMDYKNLQEWDFYTNDISTELTQLIAEGKDIDEFIPIFESVAKLSNSEHKSELCDVLYKIAMDAKIRDDYKYYEPSDLDGIKKLRKQHKINGTVPDADLLKKKIHGAWTGRIAGCLLGKPLEGIRTNELIPLLKETGNYPMSRYVLKRDITEEMCNRFKFNLRDKCFADTVDGMPVDDDTNYTALYQLLIEKYGRDFTPENVARLWLGSQSRDAYFTAERVAFGNFVRGYAPPESAIYKNPYREWIGAQIRADYFGYINPGKPEIAAEMAYRDASISHIKNGIYGEMFAAAMLACAAVTDDINEIIMGGLAEIPHTSRLYEAVTGIINMHNSGKSINDCYKHIHSEFDEHTGYGWCHTISNAMIVTTGLLYGEGDLGKSICIAVEAGFDTDCNGATVGSVIGMRNGIDCIGEEWTKPLNDTLHTSIFGIGTVKISELAEKTLKHI